MASSSKDTTHKRKTENESEKEPAAGKKKSRLSKTMSKKNSMELLEALCILDPKLLVEEIRSDVVEYFTSEDLHTFVGKLFEEDEPMLKIAKLHQDCFIASVNSQKMHLWNFSYTGILTAEHCFWKKSTH